MSLKLQIGVGVTTGEQGEVMERKISAVSRGEEEGMRTEERRREEKGRGEGDTS